MITANTRMGLFSPAGHSEADLVTRAQAGDREAFGDLYELHLAAIYRYVYYRLSDRADAEDLTETVFLRAWEALGNYRLGGAPFLAWLYRIAHNLLVDRHRAWRATAPLDDEHRDDTPESDPEALAAASQRTTRLADWLKRLDPIPQQVLALRFIAGLSHAETARMLGRTEAAVRVMQHRALAALRVIAREDGYLDD